MYKYTDNTQSNFLNFNQPMGLRLFKDKEGRVAKPLRLALGSLIIQTKYQYSDRELVDQLTENPYYQYFIGLPGYQEEPPIDASTLVLFRKRLITGVIMEANEYVLEASYGLSRPRMYRRQARKNFLALAKAKKRSTKKSEQQFVNSCLTSSVISNT